MAVISGNRATAGTLGINADKRVIDMSDTVHLLEPDKNPLILLLTQMGTGTVYNPVYKELEDERVGTTDRVNNGAGYTSAATSVVVDDGTKFFANALVRVQRTGETMSVTSVSTNTLTVTRSWGAVAAAALLDNDQLTIMGTAMEEGSSLPTARSTKSVTKTNFTQIVRDTFEVTGTNLASKMYGPQDIVHVQKVRGIEHSVYMENAVLFGEKAEVTSGATARRSVGGVDEHISTNSTDFGGTLTLAEIFNAAETDFRYGSATKINFASAAVVSNISLLAAGSLEVMPKDQTFGMNITRLVTPHGDYLIKKHHLLQGDTYGTRGYILDLDGYKVVYLSANGENRRTMLKTNVGVTGKDARMDEYFTEFGLRRVQEKKSAEWTNAA
jgi:hypothetical protein